ncbi:hypothetical protein MTR67_006813 [Solanum verrucosum]|uniref:Uncharacterized protein n=1 Tax=Solanum verrucosum TaxID=315347 RepID=A0AAF0PZ09_SOLVR|nr:hypothetical protein MTR67_006813 [Solanum verrucosum]
MHVVDICVSKDLPYAEVLMAMLDWQVRNIWTREVVYVKVLWRNNNVEEIALEAEEEIRKKYSQLLMT